MKLSLAASGGTYVTYQRATSNALAATGNTGTFYAIEIQNPTFSQNGAACTASLLINKSLAGSVTALWMYPGTGGLLPSMYNAWGLALQAQSVNQGAAAQAAAQAAAATTTLADGLKAAKEWLKKDSCVKLIGALIRPENRNTADLIDALNEANTVLIFRSRRQLRIPMTRAWLR